MISGISRGPARAHGVLIHGRVVASSLSIRQCRHSASQGIASLQALCQCRHCASLLQQANSFSVCQGTIKECILRAPGLPDFTRSQSCQPLRCHCSPAGLRRCKPMASSKMWLFACQAAAHIEHAVVSHLVGCSCTWRSPCRHLAILSLATCINHSAENPQLIRSHNGTSQNSSTTTSKGV